MKFEKALPRHKECDLEKASRLYMANEGVGCDGFHSEVLLDVKKETVCMMMLFLILKNVRSER